ncbi:MAG: hypothetical protein KAJ55_00220 [Anaerolineales bacterium]|nr:hypothetical protein [Anaerolineales bacterium]
MHLEKGEEMSKITIDGNGVWVKLDGDIESWHIRRKETCDNWSWWRRRRAAWFWRLLFPNYSSCYSCKTSWAVISGHVTHYSSSSGMFPLCERCWMNKTPKERLPFYRELWEEWEEESPGHKDWGQIERAVLREDRDRLTIELRPESSSTAGGFYK